jgi:hypothetical protein
VGSGWGRLGLFSMVAWPGVAGAGPRGTDTAGLNCRRPANEGRRGDDVVVNRRTCKGGAEPEPVGVPVAGHQDGVP